MTQSRAGALSSERGSDQAEVGTRPKVPRRGHALGPALEPAIHEATERRLRRLRWFITDWQRGGAATGRAVYRGPEDEEHDVVLKVPVRPKEIRWLTRLSGGEDEVGPRVYRADHELAGYDFAWVLMERFPHGPIARDLTEDNWRLFADVAARFYRRAADYEVDSEPRHEDWAALVLRARDHIDLSQADQHRHWKDALRDVRKHIDLLVKRWESRPTASWCHGDLHPANAMLREKNGDRAYLIDMAEVHAGHWVEDAVYVERLFWSRPDMLQGTNPVKRIAKARKVIGLEPGADDALYADIRRVLMAATAPAFLKTEGNPAHLRGALEVLQKRLPLVLRELG
jgi:hypothetical protein